MVASAGCSVAYLKEPSITDHPHVLVVGKGDDVLPAIWAQRANAMTSMIAPLETLRGEQALDGHDRVVQVPTGMDVDGWIAEARAVAVVRPVTAVATFEDRLAEIAEAIALELGVARQSAGVARAMHHKPTFRQVLHDAGVQGVPHTLAGSVDEILRFAQKHGWPVVVKPVRGAGSTSVTAVTGPADVEAAFALAESRHELTGDGAFVEAYLPGPTVQVEMYSETGEHLCVAMSSAKFTHPLMVCRGIIVPALINVTQQLAVQALLARALDAIGVTDGPSHFEVKLGPDGPRIVEGHTRVGGDRIPTLVRMVYGLDLDRLIARFLLGEPMLTKLRRKLSTVLPRGAIALAFTGPPVSGVLRSINGISEARNAPQITDVRRLLDDGAPTRPQTSAVHRGAAVRADAETPERAWAAACAAAELITFAVDQPGSDLVSNSGKSHG